MVESLYKIGFRKGDIQIISVHEPTGNIRANERYFNKETLIKIKSLLDGALWVSGGEYVGES